MQRTVRRENATEFCDLEIRLTNGRLSVCGTAGRKQSKSASKRQAKENWVSYFEGQSYEEIRDFVRKHRPKSKVYTATNAARIVQDIDGDFHGVDVIDTSGKTTYVVECCGQIREELSRWFPDAEPLFAWHLNDMKAGCEHQDELGFGKGTDVVFTLRNNEGEREVKVFKDSLSAPCPTCGYRYGTQWLSRELPQEIIELAETIQ